MLQPSRPASHHERVDRRRKTFADTVAALETSERFENDRGQTLVVVEEYC